MMSNTQDLWNLTALFKDKESLQNAIQKSIEKAKAFEETYKDKIASLTPQDFYKSIQEYEKICEELSGIMTYAFLCFAQNTKEGAFYAECEMQVNKAQESLLFFELEFNALDSALQNSFIQNAKEYRYYLELLSKDSKHQLSLKEETILLKTQPVGVDSFKRLFDEHLSHLRFTITQNDTQKEVGEEEVLSLLYDKNREVRKMAQESEKARKQR